MHQHRQRKWCRCCHGRKNCWFRAKFCKENERKSKRTWHETHTIQKLYRSGWRYQIRAFFQCLWRRSYVPRVNYETSRHFQIFNRMDGHNYPQNQKGWIAVWFNKYEQTCTFLWWNNRIKNRINQQSKILSQRNSKAKWIKSDCCCNGCTGP